MGYGFVVDCYRGRGSGYSRLGNGISPLEGGGINPTIEPPKFTQDWEKKRLLRGTSKTLCAPGPRIKKQ